jgi:hypothetical protein
MFGHGSALPRRALDRADDFEVGAAAADIAVHVLDDVVARRKCTETAQAASGMEAARSSIWL